MHGDEYGCSFDSSRQTSLSMCHTQNLVDRSHCTNVWKIKLLHHLDFVVGIEFCAKWLHRLQEIPVSTNYVSPLRSRESFISFGIYTDKVRLRTLNLNNNPIINIEIIFESLSLHPFFRHNGVFRRSVK